MKSQYFDISFRCYYDVDRFNTHHQRLKLSDIPKWIESYYFTHPDVHSISVKVWFSDDGGSQ